MSDTQEIHNYPFDSIINFKKSGHSFSYKIIKEGTYPNKSLLAYTLPPNKYRIPDDYMVETTWEVRRMLQIYFIKNIHL
ncbi:unnamed protein product [Rhizophagus irregularis]|nr:unnamed protein product [Rhizophagus irregularis]